MKTFQRRFFSLLFLHCVEYSPRMYALIFVYNQFLYQFFFGTSFISVALTLFYFLWGWYSIQIFCSVVMKLLSKTIALIWWIIAWKVDSIPNIYVSNIDSIDMFSGCKAEFPYSSSHFSCFFLSLSFFLLSLISFTYTTTSSLPRTHTYTVVFITL